MTISAFQSPYVLDNSVISALHQAGALRRVLELWTGQWVIPVEVKEEAAAWRGEAQRIIRILDDLCAHRIASYAELDPRAEGPLFARLNRTLGQGESATIAIAYHRRLGAALDDYAARRACERLAPPVPWIATEGILRCAVAEGHLSLAETREIWAATSIRDPKREVT